MILNNIKTRRKDSGFTIVELLVVIVVIGILAAITIVSYAGVTAKANTSSEQAAANAFIQKAEAYNADQGSYPTTFAALTTATSDKVYALTGVTVTGTVISTAPTAPPANSVNYYRSCTGGGIEATYWNYQTSALNYIQSGATAAGNQTTNATGCVIQGT